MSLENKTKWVRGIVAVICLAYVAYAAYTYTGLFRFMAELSIEYIGIYESTLVGILVYFILYFPLHLISARLISHFHTQGNDAMEMMQEIPSTEVIQRSQSDIEKELKQQAGIDMLAKIYNRLIIGAVVVGMAVLLYTTPIIHFWETIIDNPTNKTIRVTVDDITYDIPANTWQRHPVGRGVHTVQLDGKVVWSFERGWLWTDANSILNPTLYTYILTDTVYATEERAGNVILESLEVDGKTYAGIENPRMVSDLYIRNSGLNGWTFGLWEKLPYTRSQSTDYEKMTKIFHKMEFELEYRRFQID